MMLSSDSSISARVSKGMGALSFGLLINVANQLSVVPIAMYAWGKVRYGEWVALSGMVSFLRLSDLGLQTYVVNCLCASHARGDWREMRRVLHSTLMVQYPLIAAILGLVLSVLFLFPIDRVMSLHTTSGFDLSGTILFLTLDFLIGVPMGVIAGLYRATGLLARGAIIGAFHQTLLLVFTLVLIAGGKSFVSLAVSRVAIGFLMSMWIVYDLKRFYPWLDLWPDSGTWHEGISMIGPGLLFLLIPVADSLATQFVYLIIQRTLGGGEVSLFSTHMTVARSGQIATTLLSIAAWPELTALHAKGQNQYLVRAKNSLTKANMWIIGAVLFGMLPFLPWIYSFWTSRRLTLDYPMLAILVIRMIIWGMWSASMSLLMAINRHRSVAFTAIGSAVITSVLAIPLVPAMGIRGAALAGLIGDLCFSAWLIPLLACWEINDIYGKFWLQMGSALLQGIGIPVILGLSVWVLLPSELLHWLAFVCLAGLGFGLMWRCSNHEERRFVLHLYEKASAGIRQFCPS